MNNNIQMLKVLNFHDKAVIAEQDSNDGYLQYLVTCTVNRWLNLHPDIHIVESKVCSINNELYVFITYESKDFTHYEKAEVCKIVERTDSDKPVISTICPNCGDETAIEKWLWKPPSVTKYCKVCGQMFDVSGTQVSCGEYMRHKKTIKTTP